MSKYNYSFSMQGLGGVAAMTGSVAGDMALEGQFAVTAGGTNLAKPVSVVHANIKAVALLFVATGSSNGSVGGSCTLKTNSSGSPQDTITLADGVPQFYALDVIGAVPFSGDVTEFYLTDASTGSVGGTFTFLILTNE